MKYDFEVLFDVSCYERILLVQHKKIRILHKKYLIDVYVIKTLSVKKSSMSLGTFTFIYCCCCCCFSFVLKCLF